MAKKRGLGRSLDALLIGSGSTATIDEMPSSAHEKLATLPVTMIHPGKYQPRRVMNPEALDELANSIRAQGVIQPIVVRPMLGGEYELVAGERRWRATQLAGLTEIPVIIKNIPDEAAVAIALIENIQREDLNPIEEAMALQRLIAEFSMTHQEIADAVGKSRATVTNLLRLLTLVDEVKVCLEEGEIEMGHARALLCLTEPLQIEAAQLITRKSLSVRETEALVRKLQLPKLPDLPKAIDPDIRRLQDDLSEKLRMSVAIQSNGKGKGKVTIQYKDMAELDTILEYFQ